MRGGWAVPQVLAAELVIAGLGLESAFGAFLVTNATLIANVAVFSAAITASNAMQRRARAAARAAYNANLKDREITIRSAVAPRRVIYGRDKVSGPLIYAQSTGDKGQYLHLVIALATHECDAIEEIWFNDEKLPEPDAGGWITSGPFGAAEVLRGSYSGTTSGGGTITLPHAAQRITDITQSATESNDAATYTGTHTPGSATVSGLPGGVAVTVGYEYGVAANKVRIRKHLGQPGQVADADLVAESGGTWTSAHKGTGVCYLYVRLEYDQDMFAQVGVPNISAVVRGKKVPDPRTGATAWTENAALITADWLRDATFGLRASAPEVPAAEVIAAANICDELVTLDASGATQKRYTFNGSFTTDQPPRAVLEDVLSSMAGACVWTQGRWLIRPGAYRTPDSGAEITDDDLAGPISIQPRSSRSELFNAVRATYRDPAQKWAEVQAPLVTNATYEAQDGGVRVVRNITLPCAMDPLRAQRLAKIELERSRQAVTVQLATSMRAYNLAPTDTALLMMARYGWASGKAFEVAARTWSPEGALQYTVRETTPAIYAWAYGEATIVDPAPDTDLPSPYARPAAPASLAVASGTSHLLQQADGTIVSRASVTWVASAQPFVQQGGGVEVQWSASAEDAWQSLPRLPGDAAQAYIAPLPDGQAIVVRVRAVNAIGVRGAWAYMPHVVVGKSALPAVPAGFSGQISTGLVRWVWSPSAELDYARTEIRSADAGWGGAGALWSGAGSDWQEPIGAAGTLTRYIRHIDTSGNISATAASASVAVTIGDLIATIAATAAQALDAADGKIASHYQATAPAAADEGDLWFDTDDGNRQYIRAGGAWVLAADTRIGAALSAASDAQATADGKVLTFVQSTAPAAEAVGDLWLDSDDGNRLYRWSGSAWVAVLIGTKALDLTAINTQPASLFDSAPVGGSSGWVYLTMAYAGVVRIEVSGQMYATNAGAAARGAVGSPFIEFYTNGSGAINDQVDDQHTIEMTLGAGQSYRSGYKIATTASVDAGNYRARVSMAGASGISPPYPIDFEHDTILLVMQGTYR